MRLIGTLDDERKALVFSLFLNQKGIVHQLDVKPNTDWGSSHYGSVEAKIWIYDEDQVEEALKWYQHFLEHPEDPVFNQIISKIGVPLNPTPTPPSASMPPPPPAWTEDQEDIPRGQKAQLPPAWTKQPMGPITRLLLLICCALFFLTQLSMPVEETPSHFPYLIFSSPVERTLLYDYPYKYELINRFVTLFGYERLEGSKDLSADAHTLIQKINQTPVWQGIYPYLQKHGFQNISEYFTNTPKFERIQAGEIWRTFTPALLHADIFHLFFNMIWLIVLGKQIEQHLKPWRYILFLLLTGIFSNTSQYLMSGPNFIGFSGILCAMLAFIWVRQRYAPWEGYQLERMTMLFITLFIVSMAVLQLIFFFVETATDEPVSSGLANTAHLTGALIGLILGRLNFFSWRHA